MIFQKQLFRHNPPESIGDCHRTAIACLLNLKPQDVPHFGATFFHNPERFNDEIDLWLADRGLALMSVVFNGDVQQVLTTMHFTNPGLVFMLSGHSKNGVNHTVIAGNRRILWDPSLDESGIVGPCDDGMFWVSILVPKFHKLT